MPTIKRSGPPVPIGQNVVRVGSTHRQQHRALYPDKRVWHTDSKGKKDVRLVLQDDRNLVLYAAERPTWSSKTNTAEPPPPAPEHIAPEPAPQVEAAAVEEPAPAREPAPQPPPAPEPAVRTYPVWCPVTPDGLFRSDSGDRSKYQQIADASGIENPTSSIPVSS